MSQSQFFDLLIIDDIYPSSFSPFRTLEYNHYMWFFDAAVLSLEGSKLWIENNSIEENLNKLDIDPKYKSRIFPFRENNNISARLAYVTFLGNAYRLLPYFTSRKIPFILQLYPGGGFGIDIAEIDLKLREVLHSQLCVKVITTQTITKNYIIDKIGCDPKKVEFIFGGVFNSRVEFDYYRDKKIYGKDKSTIDFCFVAHKYGDDLVSKGYDYFIKIAKELSSRFDNIRFHVVGGYSANDIPLGDSSNKFTFYGKQPSSFFTEFYPRMDAIISYNRPYVLMPGAFDGFPTGACMEAGFSGVANFINDPLNLNISFEDGKDILLLNDNFEETITKISNLISDPKKLADLGCNSWRSFKQVLDLDKQLWARTKIIGDELIKHKGLVACTPATKSDIDGEHLRILTESLNGQVDQLKADVAHWNNIATKLASGILNRIFEKFKNIVRHYILRRNRT